GLAAAIATARQHAGDVDAQKGRAIAELALVVDAARRGDHARALALLAGPALAAAPGECALGLAVDDERQVAVVRDAAGATHGRYVARRGTATLVPAALIPRELIEALAGCARVSVFAPAPIH